MKVYEKVVIDIESGEILEEVSYYTDQTPAMCDFGTTVEAPPPPEKSQTQANLEQLQLEQLEKSNMYSDLVTPVTLANAGYKMVTQPDGTQKLEMLSPEERIATMSPLDRSLYEASLRNMGLSPTGQRLSEAEVLAGMSDAERRDYELEKAYQERQQMALSGTLPVSPALEQDLAEQEKTLSDSLAMRLGPDWQLSTPGQKAMGEFKKRAELLREEARRGQISTGEALIASRSADQRTNLNKPLAVGDYLSTLGGQTGNKLYATPQLYGGLTQTTGRVINPYQSERMTVYDNNVSAAMQSSANKAALYGSLISGASQMGGMAIYKSSKEYKKNIEPIEDPIEKILAINGVSFDWKEDESHDFGVIAEQVEKVMPEAVGEENGMKGVYYFKLIPLLVEAIKAQQSEINALKAGC